MKSFVRHSIVALFLAAPLASGQSKPALSFEVATVKPAAPLNMQQVAADMQAGRMPRFGPQVNAGRADYTYMTVKDLIAVAYNVKAYQITGPDWLGSTRFDIVAKFPEGASKDDAPAMLQSLLQERFKLTAHQESAEHKVLALVLAKDGPKLEQGTAPTAVDIDAPLKPNEVKIAGPDGPIRVTRNPDGSATMNMGAKGIMNQRLDIQNGTMHLDSSMVTMEGFADMLTDIFQMGGGGSQRVVDQTGLKGNYRIALDLSLTEVVAIARSQGLLEGINVPGTGAAAPTNSSTVPTASDPRGSLSIYQSVEKLGLKLDDRKATVSQLVIDHIEKTPTEN